MNTPVFLLLLSLVALAAFAALLLTTAFLAGKGQAVGAFFTGTGAVVCLTGLYNLLTTFGQMQ